MSSQGAIGLMQVMPVHLGSYGCFADLVNVDTNICHGASILKHMVRRTKSVSLALKRYNGCVRGRNTPRCYRYPVRVLRTASRLRREMLLTAADSTMDLQEVLAASPRRANAGPQLVTSPDSAGSEAEDPRCHARRSSAACGTGGQPGTNPALEHHSSRRLGHNLAIELGQVVVVGETNDLPVIGDHHRDPRIENRLFLTGPCGVSPL